MALTGMEIYKNLAKTNCGDCGYPTCLAFAMQVAAKQKAITECPHLSEEAKATMSEASTPPMKLVHIGPADESGSDIGQETVMFRHEERFHHQPLIAIRIPASVTDDEALARMECINKAMYTRVGQEVGIRLTAVELDGLSVEAAVTRVKILGAKSRTPFILMAENPRVLGAAAREAAAKKPLLYKATPETVEAFTAIALETKCPLAVGAPTLEELADLTKALKEKGVTDLILTFDGKDTANSIRAITRARRAALKKNFRALGYPALVDVSLDDPVRETVLAGTFVATYAAVLIISGSDSAELLPILTIIQNIYTNPQVPNTVEPKLYEIGAVTDTSPVLFTTNFALTYFSVEGEVERSKVPAYISVVDTEGLGVLNAYAGDKLSAEKVVKALQAQGVAQKVSHRKLIIPGLLPIFRAEIEDTSEWTEVLIGPENASGIPAFLTQNWK